MCNIEDENVKYHRDVEEHECPGPLFPEVEFKTFLAANDHNDLEPRATVAIGE